jgi:hypothetical protein
MKLYIGRFDFIGVMGWFSEVKIAEKGKRVVAKVFNEVEFATKLWQKLFWSINCHRIMHNSIEYIFCSQRWSDCFRDIMLCVMLIGTQMTRI